MAVNKKAHRECMSKLYEYAKWFGNHKPNVDTKFWRYREATKQISEVLYRQFLAFDNENPDMDYDLECIEEAFIELEKIKQDI